jgi:uncharacterized membrane protein YqiK
MTALHPEAKTPEPEAQVKVDATLSQNNVDTNVAQNKSENTEQSKPETKEGESPEDPNWKAFREARKKDRVEREAAERRATEKENEVAALKAAMEAAFSAKSGVSQQSYQQYYGTNSGAEQTEESEEQRIERKVNEQLSKREEQYKRQRAEDEQREYPNRLLKDFPDFKQVCSQENLDYLDYHFPEIASLAADYPDGYDKWKKTYNAVKKFIPNHSNARREAARADLNSNKPRSMSSSGPSPTGDKVQEGWQDTESRRAANWARMQRTLKGV